MQNSVLASAYDSAAAGVAGDGIVATDLPGYDPMGSAGWRLFRSSNAGVVAHESLVVTQPTYNTEVAITSVLTSEKYARYAERYADDETWGLAFSLLANQEVSTTFTVLGTSGEQNPSVTAAVRIVGVDASGADEAWVVTTAYELTEGSTAADLYRGRARRRRPRGRLRHRLLGLSTSTPSPPPTAACSIRRGYGQVLAAFRQRRGVRRRRRRGHPPSRRRSHVVLLRFGGLARRYWPGAHLGNGIRDRPGCGRRGRQLGPDDACPAGGGLHGGRAHRGASYQCGP